MLKIDFCLQCGEIPIFCMLCVCFVFVFVEQEQIGPGSRAHTKLNVCASFVFVFVNTLGRPHDAFHRTQDDVSKENSTGKEK